MKFDIETIKDMTGTIAGEVQTVATGVNQQFSNTLASTFQQRDNLEEDVVGGEGGDNDIDDLRRD